MHRSAPPVPAPRRSTSLTGAQMAMTRSATAETSTPPSSQAPPVLRHADRTSASTYSFGAATSAPSVPRQSNSSSSWLAGVRARLSQLANMSDWLSQLGLAAPVSPAAGRRSQMAQGPSTRTPAGTPDTMPFDGTLSDELYGTAFSFKSIKLDECAEDGDDDNDNGDDFYLGAGGGNDERDRDWNDTMERQHFGPLRELETVGTGKPAIQHVFEPYSLLHPTWCDKCGDFIWGWLRQAVRCPKCQYTCHERCSNLVGLECRGTMLGQENPNNSSGESTLSEHTAAFFYPVITSHGRTDKSDSNSTCTLPSLAGLSLRSVGSDKENGRIVGFSRENPLFGLATDKTTLPRTLLRDVRVEQSYATEPAAGVDAAKAAGENGWAGEELLERIHLYNSAAPDDEALHLRVDDSASGQFCGAVRVHMNLMRPINVVSVNDASTIDMTSEAPGTSKTTAGRRTLTSFFLPRGTVKTLALHSKLSTRQMVVALLRKFRVADNPRKYALYECTSRLESDAHTLRLTLARVPDDAYPLRVALAWGSPRAGRHFVLQENDTGDILWDAFAVPELENFVRILEQEEKQYAWQIKQKWGVLRYNIDQELRRRGVSTDLIGSISASASTYYNADNDAAAPSRRAPSPPNFEENEFDDDDSMASMVVRR